MGMREDAGHGEQRQAGEEPRGSTEPPGGGRDDQADQDRERRRGGEPPREDIESDRVSPPEEDFERLTQGRGNPEQPASERWMLGIVAEDGGHHLAIEEMPTPVAEGCDIDPTGPDVERLVDRQSRIGQGQEHHQAGGEPDPQSEPARRPEIHGDDGCGHRGWESAVR